MSFCSTVALRWRSWAHKTRIAWAYPICEMISVFPGHLSLLVVHCPHPHALLLWNTQTIDQVAYQLQILNLILLSLFPVFLTVDNLFRQWLSTNITTPSKSLYSFSSDLLQVNITRHWLAVWKSKHSVIGCHVIATNSHNFFFNFKNWLVLERKSILKL